MNFAILPNDPSMRKCQAMAPGHAVVGTNAWRKKPQSTKIVKNPTSHIHTYIHLHTYTHGSAHTNIHTQTHDRITGLSIHLIEERRITILV